MRKSRSLLRTGPIASPRWASVRRSYQRQQPSSPSGSWRVWVSALRNAGTVRVAGIGLAEPDRHFLAGPCRKTDQQATAPHRRRRWKCGDAEGGEGRNEALGQVPHSGELRHAEDEGLEWKPATCRAGTLRRYDTGRADAKLVRACKGP